MTRQSGNPTDADFLRQGVTPASGFQAESFPRWAIDTDSAIAATGVALSVGVPVQAGDVITSISFMSGATAAGTPTAWFFALYGTDDALLAQTADQTTTAWAADTVQTIALATPQLIRLAGIVHACIAVTATTVPTVLGRVLGVAGTANGVIAGQASLARSHGSAVGGGAPATIATPTDVATMPYVILT